MLFLLLGYFVLFSFLTAVCALLAFFIQDWQTGCVLLAVAAVSILLNLTRDSVLEIAGHRSESVNSSAGPDEVDQPSPWVVVAALTLGLGILGILGMVAGLVAFLVNGWAAAFTLLGAGTAGSLVGFAPLGWLREKRKAPSKPPARVRPADVELHLGDHVHGFHGGNPLFWLAMVPVVLVTPFLVSGGVTWLVGDDGAGLGKAAAPLLLFLFLVILAGPYLAVMILRFMPKSLVRTHLYSGGLVQTVNGRDNAARWGEIRSIEAVRHRGAGLRHSRASSFLVM